MTPCGHGISSLRSSSLLSVCLLTSSLAPSLTRTLTALSLLLLLLLRLGPQPRTQLIAASHRRLSSLFSRPHFASQHGGRQQQQFRKCHAGSSRTCTCRCSARTTDEAQENVRRSDDSMRGRSNSRDRPTQASQADVSLSFFLRSAAPFVVKKWNAVSEDAIVAAPTRTSLKDALLTSVLLLCLCSTLLSSCRFRCGRGISSSTHAPSAAITSCQTQETGGEENEQSSSRRLTLCSHSSSLLRRSLSLPLVAFVDCSGTYALSARRTIRVRVQTNARLRGACATTRFTSTASAAG